MSDSTAVRVFALDYAGSFVGANDMGKPVQFYISTTPPHSIGKILRRRDQILKTYADSALRKEVRYA